MKKTEDRQLFKKLVLQNGIEIYFQEMAVPFFEMRVLFPIGNAHSGGENSEGIMGIAHFIEHMFFDRSTKYIDKNSFEKEVKMAGGDYNAYTDIWHTDIRLTSPANYFKKFLAGLLDHLYNPIFNNTDIETQKGIIKNERDRRKYYPGNTELENYIYSKWQKCELYTKEQIFGSDADLKLINKDILEKFHKNYFTEGTKIIIAGNFDQEYLINSLKKVKTKKIILKSNIKDIEWASKNFHRRKFKSISTTNYIIGGFSKEIDDKERMAITFIGDFLLNSAHGDIYTWLRKNKGWTYGIDFNYIYTINYFSWCVTIPLNREADIHLIQRELDERITRSLTNENKIKDELKRKKLVRLFYYQTPFDRVDMAADSLIYDGHIITENERMKLMDEYANTKYLMKVYKKYLSPEARGEFIAVPKSLLYFIW